ncbi:MAG: glycosyltransferase family 4 protein [candidate division WOR-3 bacterium]|nr:MAG: glycosyltransferase family 4 protein [candidate division WOR-3 bacterium]
MAKAIEKHCGDIYYLGPIESNFKIIGRACNKISQLFFKRKYNYTHSLMLAKSYARTFNNKIRNHYYDLIFAPAAATEIALLQTKIPIVYSSDITFALMNNYYPEFTGLLNISAREGNIIEELAIKKAALIFYPTKWVARSAIKHYHADKTKIFIIPFGANLDEIPSKEEIFKKKKSGRCRLFFLGVDWKRKGGEIAFETFLKLEDLGIQSELIVCGCTPPKEFRHHSMTVIPFLNKNDERQRKKLNTLFYFSDFFLLPTSSECSPIVFCEANAFGLPVITTDTGGVTGIIKKGENGFALPISARGTDYAKIICHIYKDDRYYAKLVRASRQVFEDKLTWDTWGVTVKKLVTEIL